MKNEVTFLRVKDDPIVSAPAITPFNVQDNSRIFHLADSVNNLWLFGGYPIRPFRFEIPCDNTMAENELDYQSIFLQGRFGWQPAIEPEDTMRMRAIARTRLDSMGGGGIDVIPHMTTTHYFPPSSTFPWAEPIADQMFFTCGVIIKAGYDTESLFIELWLEDMGSESPILISEAGGWVQGIVTQGVERPYPESRWVEQGEEPGSWTDDDVYLNPWGQVVPGHATSVDLPWFNRSRIGDS